MQTDAMAASLIEVISKAGKFKLTNVGKGLPLHPNGKHLSK
jgi:hypothetical protein